jgi:uncharacterized membrane protein YbhN (UPF0104 family)
MGEDSEAEGGETGQPDNEGTLAPAEEPRPSDGDNGPSASESADLEALDKASRKKMLIGIVGTFVVLIVVFWFIFTFVIDPQIVVDAFLSLEIWQLGVLGLMAAATYVLLGFAFKITLGGLGIKDATLGMLASLAVKGSIPGPMDTAFRFRLAVAYDYSIEESTLSAATLKALDWIARLLMIPIAIGILMVSGQGIDGLEWLAIIGLIVSIVGIILMVGIVRSERIARRAGETLQSLVAWLAKRFNREAPVDLTERVLGLREMGNNLVNQTGLLGLGMKIVTQAAWASILTLALFFVDIDFDVLPISIVWAAVALVYMLPIGPGFIEIAYIGIFGLAIGFDNPMLDLAAAGVMIFRIFQWLIPIPIGYGLILYWQKRDHFSLLSADSAQYKPTTEAKPEE